MTNAIIYARVSTEEQNPENQIDNIKTLLPESNTEAIVLLEKQSAWKDKDRPQFNMLVDKIKHSQVCDVYVWDLDRLYRNRKKIVAFMELCKAYKVKVHSYRQQWLEDLHKAPDPWGEIMTGLMVQIMGWMAEDESKKKSERVKAAVKRGADGVTRSYKGNKWGDKGLPKQTINRILEAHKSGLSIREIASQVRTWDKNNNPKPISKSVVHKYIQAYSK